MFYTYGFVQSGGAPEAIVVCNEVEVEVEELSVLVAVETEPEVSVSVEEFEVRVLCK